MFRSSGHAIEERALEVEARVRQAHWGLMVKGPGMIGKPCRRGVRLRQKARAAWLVVRRHGFFERQRSSYHERLD